MTAVVLNTTVTEPTAGSFLTLYPFGGALPTASNLNFGPDQTVPNLVTVKVGDDGKINVYNAVGETHVILDIAGWYGDAADPNGYFHPVPPARVLDTRTSVRRYPQARCRPGKRSRCR